MRDRKERINIRKEPNVRIIKRKKRKMKQVSEE